MTEILNKYEKIYRQAIYVVIWKEREIVFRVGENNSEINRTLNELNAKSFAFITAHNPFSNQLSKTENEDRQNQLMQLLQFERFDFLKGYSTNEEQTWEQEESLFILDITEEKSIEIGKDFGQNAILFGQKDSLVQLIWCN